jgi:hypothetical protein
MLCRDAGSLDITIWQRVREEGSAAFVDREIPEEVVVQEHWPTLTPAGIQPQVDPEDQWYRSHV